MKPFNQLRRDIEALFDRDPAARNIFEVIPRYSGLQGLNNHSLSNFFWRHHPELLDSLTSHLDEPITKVNMDPGSKPGSCGLIGETAEIGLGSLPYKGPATGGDSKGSGKRCTVLENCAGAGSGETPLGLITLSQSARVGAGFTVTGSTPFASSPGCNQAQVKKDLVYRGPGFDTCPADIPDQPGEFFDRLLKSQLDIIDSVSDSQHELE